MPIGRCLIVSDFTVDPLAPALDAATPALSAEIAPFGTVVPSMMDPPTAHRDAVVVWTRPELMLRTIAAAVAGEHVDAGAVLAEVDDFARLLTERLSGFRCVFVPSWTMPTWVRGRGILDLRPGGLAWALGLANSRLVESLATSSNCYVLDAQRWISTVGEKAYNPRSDYLGKLPFHDRVFAIAADEIAAAYAAVVGLVRKAIVIDLDNTLWGGVVGDLGWEQLQLGGHDAAGEAFVDFQRSLKTLQRRGILLAIVSKNDEHVALEAIDRHPEMVLRRDDFVAQRINWADKAANIADIAAELNIGLQSIVFIDDNAHERARVRAALPEVLVPEWPVDPADYVRSMTSLRCFDSVSLTAEDEQRTALYVAEQRRSTMLTQVASIDEWITALDIQVGVEPVAPGNLTRASQLMNKTNQMNLRTRRLAADELLAWAAEPGHQTVCVSVSDRLGDAGLTGVLSVEAHGSEASIVDFVLSCRVMGRRIEDTMLALACRLAEGLGTSTLHAELIPTAKNAPCARFLTASAMTPVDEHHFRIDVQSGTALPEGIKLHGTGSAAP